MTRHYTRMVRIYGTLSTICTVAPIIYYTITSMAVAAPKQRVTIGFMALAAIIIGVVNLLMKVHPRCLFWMTLLAMYYVLGNILQVLVVMTITCFLDEVWFTPMYRYAKQKRSINREIDKRGTHT